MRTQPSEALLRVVQPDPNGHHVVPLYGGIGGPLYAVHTNGHAYAAFASPNQAQSYWNGLDARSRKYFRIVDRDGQEVELAGRYGHAYSVLKDGA